MKKAISKINPFRYAKKLHIGYIWLIAVLLLLVVGVICSGAKVYKYSPILSVVSYSLAAISLIAIIIMIVRKTSDMKIQSELDKYILVLNEHKDDQEWLHKELTYVNLRIYNKTNGHLYRCIIRKSKFPRFPERSVQFSGKRTKRSVQKKAAHNTYKAGAKG